jgi:hypothetical protein
MEKKKVSRENIFGFLGDVRGLVSRTFELFSSSASYIHNSTKKVK